MKTNSETRKRLFHACLYTTCVVSVLHLFCAPAFADEASCKPLLDASARTLKTPFHSHSTQTVGGMTKSMSAAAKTLGMDKPTVVEQYNTGNKTYLYTPKDGKWTSMPSDALSEVDSSPEARQQLQKTQCSVLRMESVDGEPAAVFQSVNADLGSTTTAWISQTSGLVLRMELAIEGGGAMNSHMSMTYDYKNVQLPAGAH